MKKGGNFIIKNIGKRGVIVRYYKHTHTREIVYEPDWELYAMEQLGIKIIPKGKNGELTIEQTEFIEEFTQWYFSGNWILDEEEEE